MTVGQVLPLLFFFLFFVNESMRCIPAHRWELRPAVAGIYQALTAFFHTFFYLIHSHNSTNYTILLSSSYQGGCRGTESWKPCWTCQNLASSYGHSDSDSSPFSLETCRRKAKWLTPCRIGSRWQHGDLNLKFLNPVQGFALLTNNISQHSLLLICLI